MQKVYSIEQYPICECFQIETWELWIAVTQFWGKRKVPWLDLERSKLTRGSILSFNVDHYRSLLMPSIVPLLGDIHNLNDSRTFQTQYKINCLSVNVDRDAAQFNNT